VLLAVTTAPTGSVPVVLAAVTLNGVPVDWILPGQPVIEAETEADVARGLAAEQGCQTEPVTLQ